MDWRIPAILKGLLDYPYPTPSSTPSTTRPCRKSRNRLRISLMATLERKDLEYTLEVLERVGKKYGII